MNDSSPNTVQFCITCNQSFNSKKEFIKHTVTSKHIKQSECYLNDEVDHDNDVRGNTVTLTRDKNLYIADASSSAETITKDNTIT